jgi:hypothetical protein
MGAIGGRCIGTIGVVHPGTLFHRRQRGIPMHSYENRSQIRALLGTPGIYYDSPHGPRRCAGPRRASTPCRTPSAGSGSPPRAAPRPGSLRLLGHVARSAQRNKVSNGTTCPTEQRVQRNNVSNGTTCPTEQRVQRNKVSNGTTCPTEQSVQRTKCPTEQSVQRNNVSNGTTCPTEQRVQRNNVSSGTKCPTEQSVDCPAAVARVPAPHGRPNPHGLARAIAQTPCEDEDRVKHTAPQGDLM